MSGRDERTFFRGLLVRYVVAVGAGIVGYVLGLIAAIAILASALGGDATAGWAIVVSALFLGGPLGATIAVARYRGLFLERHPASLQDVGAPSVRTAEELQKLASDDAVEPAVYSSDEGL